MKVKNLIELSTSKISFLMYQNNYPLEFSKQKLSIDSKKITLRS